jgi:clan AA aspartic protease (TIGR02281 family)
MAIPALIAGLLPILAFAEAPAPAPASACTRQQTSIPQSPRGGYWADGYINNTKVSLHIDTGANVVAVPLNVARSAGMAVGRAGRAATASDTITAFRSEIPLLRVGELVFRNVKAAIIPEAPNDEVLLGMSALQSTTLHQEGGMMVLAVEVCPPADGATGDRPPLRQENDALLKRPLRECMGPNNRIDQKALECMKAH